MHMHVCRPHIRDDAELERDYMPMMWGRYIWQLFPHTENDPDCLIQVTGFAGAAFLCPLPPPSLPTLCTLFWVPLRLKQVPRPLQAHPVS